MNATDSKIEACRQLLNQLSWNHAAAMRSARILCSKAIWLGVDQEVTFELVQKYPGADYVRKSPDLLSQAWVYTTKYCTSDNYLSEFEQLLNADN